MNIIHKMFERFKKLDNHELYSLYLKSKLATNSETKDTTYVVYKSYVKQYLKFLDDNYNKINILSKNYSKNIIDILESFISISREKGNNSQTINNKLVAISSFEIWLAKRNYIVSHRFNNKLERLKVKDYDKIRESFFLTIEEITKINNFMNENNWKTRDKLLFNLFIDTGARISAIQKIKCKDVDLVNGLIYNVKEKGGKSVTLMFYSVPKLILQSCDRFNNEEFLFNLSQTQIRSIIKKCGKIIGCEKLYPHSLRKTAINIVYLNNDLELASEFANHSDTKTTKDHYIKPKSTLELKNKIKKEKKDVKMFYLQHEKSKRSS